MHKESLQVSQIKSTKIRGMLVAQMTKTFVFSGNLISQFIDFDSC